MYFCIAFFTEHYRYGRSCVIRRFRLQMEMLSQNCSWNHTTRIKWPNKTIKNWPYLILISEVTLPFQSSRMKQQSHFHLISTFFYILVPNRVSERSEVREACRKRRIFFTRAKVTGWCCCLKWEPIFYLQLCRWWWSMQCVLCIWEGMNSTQQLVLPSFRLFMLDLLCVFQDFLVYAVKSLHSFMCASVSGYISLCLCHLSLCLTVCLPVPL